MKKIVSFLFIAAFLVTGVSSAMAQVSSTDKFGVRAGLDIGDAESFLLGVDSRFFPATLPVGINASLDYYLIDEDDYFGTNIGDLDVSVNMFNLAVNGIYEFGIDNQAFTPYAGGGLALSYISVGGDDLPDVFDDSDTDIGLSIVGGAYIQMESLLPFVQANIKTGGDFDLFSLVGGLLFEF